MKNLLVKFIFCIFSLLAALIFTACESDNNRDTTTRGNTDGNLHNLGFAAAYEDTLYYIGASSPHDLIYEADAKGNTQKAITGLTGYIQYLNTTESGFYFLGITYDSAENRSEAIFSADFNGENQNCIYTIEEGSTVTYLNAVGDLLIFAVENEKGKTEVRVVNPAESTEAILFSENSTVRSLIIENGSFYYITKNKVKTCTMDGKNKTTLYKTENWIGSMVSDGASLYFVENNDTTDTIKKMSLKGETTETILTDATYIANMNINENTLYYTDNQRDSEGDLKEARICAMNLENNTVTELATIQEDYTGISIVNDLLICHMNDESLTAKVFELK